MRQSVKPRVRQEPDRLDVTWLPSQYGDSDRCENGCGARLSIYNCFKVCGPCRVKLWEKQYVFVAERPERVRLIGGEPFANAFLAETPE